MTMAMTDPPTKLPSSPAARAFFAAFDQDSLSQTVNTSSELIKKRIATLGWRNRFSQDDTYPITVGSCQFSVTQVQRGEIDGTYGTGATVWPAAVVMIKYLERQRHLLQGKVVVDLGSGTGITSIATAILGAKQVICTDGEMSVVRLARDNIQMAQKQLHVHVDGAVGHTGCSSDAAGDDHDMVNDDDDMDNNMYCINGCPIQVQKLWWGQDQLEDQASQVDVIIVADCVLPKLYPIEPLVIAIDQLLVAPRSFALLSYEHRHYPHYDPRDKFRELALNRNLRVALVPIEEQHPVYSVDDIEIWRVDRNVSEKR